MPEAATEVLRVRTRETPETESAIVRYKDRVPEVEALSEDLTAVAAVAILPVQAAPEAIPAWVEAAADRSAVAAGEEEEAAAGGDNHKLTNVNNKCEAKMRVTQALGARNAQRIFFISLFSCCMAVGLPAGLYSNQTTVQKTFGTPDQAVDALVIAAERNDTTTLLEIFGAAGTDIVSTGDKVADQNTRTAFVTKAHEKKRVVADRSNPNRATLYVGFDDWPLPIPLVKQGGRWSFDAKAGRDEIIARRIGGNELNAMDVCEGYVDAQKEYASEIHDGKTPNQYAQRIISTPGKHDGLYWKNADGSSGGPIGEIVAKAIAEGYSEGQPFHGYYFKILKGQGPAAPMGELDFLVNDAMIGGFALIAAPAQYRVTGVKTFIVGNKGVIYQKDLGPDTLAMFQHMDRYNPDKTWEKASGQSLAKSLFEN
jgi:hypothetical protein